MKIQKGTLILDEKEAKQIAHLFAGFYWASCDWNQPDTVRTLSGSELSWSEGKVKIKLKGK